MENFYQPLDHTGDWGVEVWGDSYPLLLQNASCALIDTIADLKSIHPERAVTWTLQADSFEGLIVQQLQEILYQIDARGLIFCQFEICMLEENKIFCTAKGELFSRGKHGFKTEIKAITYHRLELNRAENGKYRARIIFDI